MSLLSDLKKIFFGATSVAKHQAEKAGTAAREKLDELSEEASAKGGELLGEAQTGLSQAAEKGKAALSDLGDQVYEETEHLLDKGAELKEKGTDWINERLGSLNTSKTEPTDSELVNDPPQRSPTAGDIDYEAGLVEDPGTSTTPREPSALETAAKSILDGAAEVGDSAAQLADGALDRAAKAGADAKAAAEKYTGKILDRAADLGSKAKETAAEFVDRANDRAEAIKTEEAAEAAAESAALEEARRRAFDGKEGDRNPDESLLDGTDSFFDRAAKFADGDYHREGSVRIVDNDDPTKAEPTKVELTKKGKIELPGFEDRDGDGNALIDDAELEEE